MSVNEANDLGDAAGDRETEQCPEPGPWSVKESRVPGYARNIDVVAGDLLICEVTGGGVSNPVVLERVRANARLIAAAPSLNAFLMKIYLDYEGDCNCQCNSENCCAVVGERCAKCHANVALLIVDRPLESAKRPISDRGNPGQASKSESV